jgi:Zn-dependent protease
MDSIISSTVFIKFFELIALIFAFLLAVTIHEFAHALTAYFLGDRTARDAGRLTLNPLAHIDPMGLLFIILFRFGWAKPVPMNQENFRYPKLYAIIAALAGPFSNFVIALALLYLAAYLPLDVLSSGVAQFLSQFFALAVWINVMLGVFNLIPIPPLDGGHIINALIPRSWYPTYYRLQPFAIIIIFMLILIPAINHALFNTIMATIAFLKTLVI